MAWHDLSVPVICSFIHSFGSFGICCCAWVFMVFRFSPGRWTLNPTSAHTKCHVVISVTKEIYIGKRTGRDGGGTDCCLHTRG